MEVVKHTQLDGAQRCSNCSQTDQIISFPIIGELNEDGSQTHLLMNRIIPVGTKRNCFTFIQNWLLAPEQFIYPEADDTCVNPKRFKPKQQAPY